MRNLKNSLLYILSLVGGYIIGSIPTAYLIVKLKAGIDIRTTGSGNVGGFNAFQVTNSKFVGYAVGVFDGLKGLVAVLLVHWLVGESFWLKATSLLGSVVGHNYPVWLKFKGGRGLATACGGLFLLGSGYTAIWCTMWVVIFKVRKDILLANVVCTLLTPFILMLLPAHFIQALMVTRFEVTAYLQFSAVLSFVLLLRHMDAIQEILKPTTK